MMISGKEWGAETGNSINEVGERWIHQDERIARARARKRRRRRRRRGTNSRERQESVDLSARLLLNITLGAIYFHSLLSFPSDVWSDSKFPLDLSNGISIFISRAFLVCHARHMSPIGEWFFFFVRSIYTGNWTQCSVRVRVEREQFLWPSPSASTSLLADWLSKRSNDVLRFSSRGNDCSKEILTQDVLVNVPIHEIAQSVREW